MDHIPLEAPVTMPMRPSRARELEILLKLVEMFRVGPGLDMMIDLMVLYG